MWHGKIQDIIIYEDRDILVCHKPAGLAVQNARIGALDLESALKNYLAEKSPGRLPYIGVVHRLDQPVEGLMVFAKNQKAAAGLSRQMTLGSWQKEYLAVTDRIPEDKKAELVDYLKKEPRANISRVAPENAPGSRQARLFYEALETIDDPRTATGKRTLLKIRLDTGRHHQIRVQLSHAGLPLLGDRKYYPEDESGLPLGLCSCKLVFKHPLSNKKKEFCLSPEGASFQGFSAF